MKLTANSISYDGDTLLLCMEEGEAKAAVENIPAGRSYEVTIKPVTKRRSINANAFFHSLVNKLARATGTSDEQCKLALVLMYGEVIRDDDGLPAELLYPAGANLLAVHPYSYCYDRREIDDHQYDCYLLYKRTRDMSTAEMAALIEGTISECCEHGVTVMMPEELESLLKTAR